MSSKDDRKALKADGEALKSEWRSDVNGGKKAILNIG